MKVIGSRAMMYLAHPTRVWKAGGSDRIVRFAREKGFAPVNPFLCGDFQDFEGGLVGREGTLRWTLHLQRGCHWSGYFGISEGVMHELDDRLKWDLEKRMRIFYEDEQGVPFDEKWHEEYERLKDKYGDLLAELRGRNHLVALVGPRAVGKTYWIERLLAHDHLQLEKVRNTTTRKPRNEEDMQCYNFVTKDQFQEKIDAQEFLEHVEYEGQCYGSSLSEIRSVLNRRNGIFAITPEGAEALYRCRFEFNVRFLVLKAPALVLKKNLEKRGILDPKEQDRHIKDAERFTLPWYIPHEVVELSRTESDENRILSVL